MPRNTAASIDAILQQTVAAILARAAPRIAQAIADLAARELERALSVRGGVSRLAGRAKGGAAPRGPRVDLTRWVADKRARRVPNFVIEATGIKTKKAIVQKFGENAAFDKGKPLPKPTKGA